MARVRIPTAFRAQVDGRSEVEAAGATVGEVLGALAQAWPGLAPRLFDERGQVRRYVNVFHQDEDIRFLQGLDTPVAAGDVLTLVPAIAGGSGGPAWP
jgi:molybdopterin converting factor small subunit